MGRRKGLNLKDGSKIAVIGAGPAGTFFADFASQMAAERELKVSIVLFDGKDFTQKGPGGCNLCAGVISETLVNRLKGRGIILPEEKVQRRIEGYYLHGKSGGLLLKHQQKENQITTVFRGNGPRLSKQGGNISFDDYLLEHVRSRGLRIIHRPVKGIELNPEPENPVRIIYDSEGREEVFEADLVVGAFGLTEDLMKKMEHLDFGYRPPRTVKAKSVEIGLKEDFIEEKFGDSIFAYNLSTVWGMSVINIIPKKNFITVNMVGIRDVQKEDLEDFLDLPVVRNKLPKDWSWSHNFCSCTPRIPITSAKKPYTNRLVIIGDASCCRYYKNGIESAFITAQIAAETAFDLGISEKDFRRGYFKRIRKVIIRDNFFGRLLFAINDLVSGSALLSEVMLKVAGREEKKGRGYHMRDFLWNMYTGNIPYKTIFLKFINPVLQFKLTAVTFQSIFIKIVFKLISLIRERGKGTNKWA